MHSNQYQQRLFNPHKKNLLSCMCLFLIIVSGCGKNIIDNDDPPSGDTYLLDNLRIYTQTGAVLALEVTLFYTYQFDNTGRVVEKLESDSNNIYSTRYTYTYDEYSMLKEATVQRTNDPVKYYYKFIYTGNHLVNVKIFRDLLPNYVNYDYTYNGDDTSTWTIKETIPDTTLDPMQPLYSKYVYHRLTGRRRLEINEENFAKIYTYDGDSKLVKCTVYNKDTLSGVSYILDYTYNNYGCVSEERFSRSTLERLSRYTYKNYGKVKSAPMFFMTFF